jgi:hypothetical protein
MGYVDKQVAQYRNRLDAANGATLRNAIRKLQEKSQIRDSLKPLRDRGAIVATAGRGKRSLGSTGGDFAEVSRTYYGTTHAITSSCGYFMVIYSNLQTMTMRQGGLDDVVFSFSDYQP